MVSKTAAGGRVVQCDYQRMYDTLREYYRVSDSWPDTDQTRITRQTVRELVCALDDIQSRLTSVSYQISRIKL